MPPEHDTAPLDTHPTYEEYLRAQRITLRDVTQHITGPVISVIFHVILIAFVGSIVVFEATPPREEIAVDMTELEVRDVETPPEPPKPPEEALDDVKPKIDRPKVKTNATAIDVGNIAVADVNVNVSVPNLVGVKPGKSALKLPQIYARRTGAQKKRAMKIYGADERNEQTVGKALDWLAANQNPDGSWGVYGPTKNFLTAQATLAFLAHGDTPKSAKFGSVLIKAIKYLLSQVKPGRITSGSPYYTHPIVAYALSEAYGITRIPKVKEAMDESIKVIMNGITKRGGFYPGYDRRPRIVKRDPYTGRMPKGTQTEPLCNLDFAGWNYQALKAAFAAGCDVPGLEKTMELAIKGLKYHARPVKAGGGFGVSPKNNPDFGMTGVGILCLGLYGEDKSKESREAYKWIKDNNREGLTNCSWKYDKKVHDKYKQAFTYALYTWYYQTQMLFQKEKGHGGIWGKWNRSFSRALIREQEKDGHWSSPAQKYGQHLDPTQTTAEWTRVKQFKDPKDLYIYATTICCLTLEVYYRYLPTYKLTRDKVAKKSLFDDDDDLGLKID